MREEIRRTSEQDRSRFSRHTSQGQNQSGDDIRHSHRQNHVPDGLKLGSSQCTASLAHAVRYCLQCLFRSTDHQRYAKQPQRQRTRQNTIAEIHIVNKQRHTEETENNRRNTAQVIGHHPDKAYQFALRRILVHVNTTHHTHRKGKQRTAHHQVECTHDSRPDASSRHPVSRSGGQKIPADHADTLIDDESQNREQNQHNA